MDYSSRLISVNPVTDAWPCHMRLEYINAARAANNFSTSDAFFVGTTLALEAALEPLVCGAKFRPAVRELQVSKTGSQIVSVIWYNSTNPVHPDTQKFMNNGNKS